MVFWVWRPKRGLILVISDDPDDETEKLAEAINAEFADACRLGNMNKARSVPGMAQVIDYAIDDWRGFVHTTVTEGQPSPFYECMGRVSVMGSTAATNGFSVNAVVCCFRWFITVHSIACL